MFSLFSMLKKAILTGEILGHQKDVAISERKYLVGGKTLDDGDTIVVPKISLTNKLVIITVYREKFEYDES